MQTTIATPGTISCRRRLMRAALGLGLLLAFGFAQSGFAQSDPPLTFANNFFVTGDYAIGGAVLGKSNSGFVTGTISIGGDQNPGVKGTNTVPLGAEIVAALLYWQTVEIVGGTTGQNGFFRPVFNGGPQTGYPIKGTILKNPNGIVYWDGSGCASSTTPKQLVTYRQEVRAFLPQDPQGNVIANGQYEVHMPSQSNGAPLMMGATLVIIYRVLSPNFPLNSIVIYDGTPASASTTTQNIQGFYDAAHKPVSKLTYIAGNGRMNLSETVFLNGPPALSSLYPGQPPFPGWYGSWDNPTWFFGLTSAITQPPNPINPNPLPEDASSATTTVVTAHQGCVTPAAIIYSTTVKNSDGDGLLDSWKTNHGYCDASINGGSCTTGDSSTGWVALPGTAKPIPGTPHPDVFVQLDYMCSKLDSGQPNGCDTSTSFTNPLSAASAASNGNTTYTAAAAFATPIPLNTFVTISGFTKIPPGFLAPPNNGNFIVVDCLGNQTVVNNYVSCKGPQVAVNNANGVAESNAAGVATFTNYSFDPRQVTDSITGANSFDEVNAAYSKKGITLHPEWHAMAETPGCTDTFPNGIASYCPYLNQPGLVGWKGGFDSLKGQPLNLNTDGTNWTEAQCEASPTTCVRRFQHGRKDSYHEVIFAHAQGGPEWSFQAETLTSVVASGKMVTFTTLTPHGLVAASGLNDQNPLARVTVSDAITNTMLNGTYLVLSTTTLSFTITTLTNAPCPTSGCTPLTDPRLSVASGRIHTRSGFSDVGGADSLVTLGRWDPLLVQQVTGTTFMHEFGHANGLSHGGFYYDQLTSNNNNYTPTVEANCKPNFQSVMNYPFQLTHLDNGTSKVVDYSEEQLDPLNEQALLGASVTINLFNPPFFYPNTLWYTPTKPFASASPANLTCDGMPVPQGTTMYLVSGPADPIDPPWANNQDINFDLKTNTQMRGHNDWTNVVTNGLVISPGLNLLQVGATGADTFGGGGSLGPGGGSLGPGGGSLGPGGGVGEVDVATATAVTYPPSDLTATEGVSPRKITLNWTPGFGLIGAYNIYRSDNGGTTFSLHATVTGNPPATTFTETVTCNPTGYQYFVTAVQSSSSPNPLQESGPSNTVSTGQNGGPLTGCYAPAGFLLSSPANAVHGSIVSVTFTVLDDFNGTNSPVNTVDNPALVTLEANGPLPNNCGTVGSTALLNNGQLTAQSGAASTFPASSLGHYTFNWDTDGFCAGQYTLKLILDNQLALSSHQMATAPLQLSIDVNDTDSTPHITTTTLTAGTVGSAYPPYALTQHGGTPPLTWNFSGALPAGMSGSSAGILSGTPCMAGPFSFMVTVTDSKSNSGTLGLNLLINQANTTTSVSSNANPAVYGQIISFTVTVAPNSPCIPTGTVTLLSDGTPITSNPLNGGTATFTTSLPVGTHNITATYGGDGNFIGSTTSAPLVQVVNKASTTTSVTSNFNPSVFGQAVTFTAAVVPVLPGAGAPTGSVTFFDGATSIGSGPVTGGVASLTTSALAVATHNITATYVGDGNFIGSTSASFSQTVNQANTTTSVSSSLNPSVFGQAVTFTAAVVPVLPGAGAPTGSVTFFDGAASIGSGPVTSGVASLTTSALAVATHNITATYVGDGNFISSTSASFSQTVN